MKTGIKIGTEVTLSSHVIDNSNDGTNFVHRLLLTNTNGSSANTKLSKIQLDKIWFLGRLLISILKIGLPKVKNVLKPLAKSVLIPLELTAESATDAAIQKNVLGSGVTTLIIWNEEMDDTMKINKSFKKSCLLIKCVTNTIENEAKEQKLGYLGMLISTSFSYIFCLIF